MSDQEPTTVVFQSISHPTENWDVMRVIYKSEDRIMNSFIIAKAPDRTIRRKTDLIEERWAIVTDEGDLKGFRALFDERDRLATRQSG
jgi:hypothetical protein